MDNEQYPDADADDETLDRPASSPIPPNPNGAPTTAKEIFVDAVELSSSKRVAFIHDCCGNNNDLVREVLALLAAHEQAGLFLASPTQADAPSSSSITDSPIGTQIGRYKLLKPIGEGGFGTVFLAQQEQPVRRQVALKIIKLGMDSPLCALGLVYAPPKIMRLTCRSGAARSGRWRGTASPATSAGVQYHGQLSFEISTRLFQSPTLNWTPERSKIDSSYTDSYTSRFGTRFFSRNSTI